MTNRQWLIWRLIDMSDEEFADGMALMTVVVMAVKKDSTHG